MISIHSSITELKNEWRRLYAQELQLPPFYSYEWHTLWHKELGGDAQLFIMKRNEEVIAPFVRNGTRLSFTGNKEISDFLDIIGSSKNKQTAWPEILDFARKNSISEITLDNIPESSETYIYFKGNQSHLVTLIKEDTTPLLEIPLSWELYLEKLTRKQRHEIRRKIRKFQTSFSSIDVCESENPREEISILIELMQKNPKKKSFLNTKMIQFFKNIPTVIENSTILFVKDVHNFAAGVLAFETPSTVYLYNSGFNEDLYPGAGFYLAAKIIDWAISKRKKYFNFLQGNERYKYELGGKDFFVYTITIKLN